MLSTSESAATTPPSKVLLRTTVLVPHCLIAIRNCDDISHRASVLVHRLVFLSKLVPSVLVAADPVKLFRAIGRHVGVALLLSFHLVGLRCDAPSKTLSRFEVSMMLNEQWSYNPVEPGYLRTCPTLHSSSNYLRKSLPHIPIPGRAISLCPLMTDLSYYEPQARLNGEGRIGHSVALCRRQLFSLLFLLLLDQRTSVSACPVHCTTKHPGEPSLSVPSSASRTGAVRRRRPSLSCHSRGLYGPQPCNR